MSDSVQSVASEIVQSQFGNEPSTEVETTTDQSTEAHSTQDAEITNDEFAKRFAALTRKDKEFRQEKEQWEAEKAQFEAMKAELESLKAEKTPQEEEMPLEYRLKREPLKVLAELGLDYETLTNLAINDGKLSPEQKMELMQQDLERKMESTYGSKLEALQQKLEEKEQLEIQQREERAVAEFKSNITNHLQENAAEYELIAAQDANDLVYQVIEEHYNETGRILEIKDAADAVESHLTEEAQKLLKLKKLVGQPTPTPESKVQSPATLSNTLSSQVPKSEDRKLSMEESKRAAASLLRWD
jgi:hypothetical protein